MRRILLITLLLSSLLSASDKTTEGEKILEQARSRSDISELPSFTMRAMLKIASQDKFPEGEHGLIWNGADQWREEISFPGFDQIRIGGPGTVALKRSLDFVPLRVHQIGLTLSYGREGLTLRPDERIKQVRTRKVSGIETKCAEITGKVHDREICVDASTGAVVRDRRFMDKEFASIGAKLFPHILSCMEQGKTLGGYEISTSVVDKPPIHQQPHSTAA